MLLESRHQSVFLVLKAYHYAISSFIKYKFINNIVYLIKILLLTVPSKEDPV